MKMTIIVSSEDWERILEVTVTPSVDKYNMLTFPNRWEVESLITALVSDEVKPAAANETDE